MQRTTVSLEAAQHAMLVARARREGKALSSLVREIIAADLRQHASVEDPFDAVIGLAATDGSAVAESHASYLYSRS